MDLDLNSNDAEEFREKNAVRATSKFLDLGDFSEIKSCSSLQIIVNIDGKVATKCPAQNLREEQNGSPNNHVFVHHCSGRMIDNAADCSGLDPIKNYYDFLEARTWGPVVKVSPKGEKHICLETQGRSLREISHCDKNSVDNPGIQFRLEPAIDQQMTNGKGKVRLRSVQNPTLCADLAGDKLVDCRQAPRLTFDPLANDLLIKKGDKWQSYFTTMCLVATSHKKSARYDCQKEIPWQYALYEKLSVGLGFVPYVGPLFSAVFDGILCGSNEEDYAVNGCIGLGLDLSLGIFFGDYIPLGQLGAATFKLASKTGTLAKTGINSASAAIQMVVQKAALRNGLTPAVARKSMFWMNDVVIDALKERDFSLKDLHSVFEKLKASNACAGAPCRMWWNPTADDTKEYVNQLRNYVSRSKMSAADKATVLEKLK